MAGFLLSVGSLETCAHQGQLKCIAPKSRVTIMGQSVVTKGGGFVVAGCPSLPPPAGPGQCATAMPVTTSTKVMIEGDFALLIDSQAICSPTGVPVTSTPVQSRVQGS